MNYEMYNYSVLDFAYVFYNMVRLYVHKNNVVYWPGYWEVGMLQEQKIDYIDSISNLFIFMVYFMLGFLSVYGIVRFIMWMVRG